LDFSQAQSVLTGWGRQMELEEEEEEEEGEEVG
jgi:hypothetical protein